MLLNFLIYQIMLNLECEEGGKIVLTKRGYQLIQELLLTRKPLTLQVLARRLGVSPRTVRTELDAIEEWLSEGSCLVRKPGVGVTLSLNDEDYHRVLQGTVPEKLLQPFSSSDRQRFIFLKLLQNDPNFRTMQQFADALYVSRIGISKDLEEVEKILARYNLQLLRKPHYGLEVEGSEENWRRAVADYLVSVVDKDVLFETLNQNIERSFLDSSRIDPISYKQIRSLFPENVIRIVREILEQTERERGMYFTDDDFVSLLIHLVIGLERIKQNKALTMSQAQLQHLREQSEFALAKQIADQLESVFNFKIPDAEIGYMALHILGAKVEHGSLEERLNLEDFNPELVQLVKGMIGAAEAALNLNLSGDKQLLLGLLLHMRPVINRLKYGMSMRNPILSQIKEQYQTVFGAAWMAGAFLEKNLGLKVSEEEIGYLAMHLGASVERQKHPKRVLVVCSSGVGTAQLLASRLRKLSPMLDVVDMVSALRVKEISRKMKEQIDAVITTVPLTEDLGYPTIRVSPLLTDQDQQRLQEFFRMPEFSPPEQANPILSEKHAKSSWFREELIINNSSCSSREEVLRTLGDLLEKSGNARPGFTQSVEKREKLSSTAVGYGIAIPHGNTAYVSKSTIAVAVLKDGVDWEGEPVDLVFMLALKSEQVQYAGSFFRRFYEAIDNPEWIRRLKNCPNSQTMADYLSLSFND